MSFWDTRVLPHLIDRACRSHAILDERRRWIPRAEGRVLEVGVGSGLNLALYDPKRVKEIVALDPSAPLLERARTRAREASLDVEIVRGFAEELPFEAARFDCVVLTYTLCSVTDPARALLEVRRVLRPGGRLVFVEHGLAPDPGPSGWQRRITPIWKRAAGNCHLDRDVRSAIEGAGLAIEEMREAYTENGPRWLAAYTVEGVAIAPA